MATLRIHRGTLHQMTVAGREVRLGKQAYGTLTGADEVESFDIPDGHHVLTLASHATTSKALPFDVLPDGAVDVTLNLVDEGVRSLIQGGFVKPELG
ncbi:MAG: hypothetical protein ACK5MP_04815 [Nostocoides sp.]